jgi:hypothetical protein
MIALALARLRHHVPAASANGNVLSICRRNWDAVGGKAAIPPAGGDRRDLPCNDRAMDKLLGAYNQYSSGFSYCHNEFSEDEKFRTYQIAAMTGFGNHYQNRTWLIKMK